MDRNQIAISQTLRMFWFAVIVFIGLNLIGYRENIVYWTIYYTFIIEFGALFAYWVLTAFRFFTKSYVVNTEFFLKKTILMIALWIAYGYVPIGG